MTTGLMITECSICLLFILSVACVRLLDNRDIRASVWVFPTKWNVNIAIDWAELASIVTTQKMLNMRRFRARLKKRRFDGKCETKSTSAGIHAETHITKAFLFCVQFLCRNCKLTREHRRNQKAYEAWAPQSQRNKYNEIR